jgi:hypothetical protein
VRIAYGKICFPRFVHPISLLCSAIAARSSAAAAPLAAASQAPSRGRLCAPLGFRRLASSSSFKPTRFRLRVVRQVAAAGTLTPTATIGHGYVPPSPPQGPPRLRAAHRRTGQRHRPPVRAGADELLRRAATAVEGSFR